MKVYLVGGAVRDQLLGLPVQERDWVVVGAMPNELIKQGYKKVGRDFPVFLHPKTQEEYALARTERKLGPGYYGFDCNFSTAVTLEEDLARRDLTINAMAMDERGNIIDPFNGQDDLQQKILRHVSPAFIEDPVRVLRVARFVARFHQLGFTLANETRALMYKMVQQGELAHLVPERVWSEWQRSLETKNPEQFLLTLRACDALRVILPELDALFGVPNPCKYHPEVDSGIHSLMVLQQVVGLTADPITRFAALVHDLGKAQTLMSAWPSHHGHEATGVPIIEALCSRLKIPNDYRILATRTARYHLNIHRIKELRATTVVQILEHNDAFRRPEFFNKLLLACQADALGRKMEISYQQREQWRFVLTECAKITAQCIIKRGFTGAKIKEALHQQRVERVSQILTSWKSHEK